MWDPAEDASYEQWLVSGSDRRVIPGADGLNPYGCSAAPRDALALGSCTCSSPSPRGERRGRALLKRLQNAADPDQQLERAAQQHRHRLRQLLRLPADVDIALTPSGTDVELLALALAAGGGDQPVVNIVVGPSEVGSGTPLAAAGKHYDTLVPCGDRVTRGTAVNETLASRVSLRTIDIRNARGEMLNEVEIDAAVTEQVADAAARNAHVLLHLVAHSKTGVHAPSLECVRRITESLGDDVTVVIDAAQGRVSRRGLQEVLRRGYLVMFTGSKFYGGPPFSGALLAPARFRPEHRGWTALPSGFEQYFTAAELPESWEPARQRLSGWSNPGAALRWEAALAEIEAYYRVPGKTRLAVLRSYEAAVPDIFADSESLHLIRTFAPIRDDSTTRLLESKTTVFAFRVVPPKGSPVGEAQLKTLHRHLNRDVRDLYPQFDAGIMGQRIHLGQPVCFDDGTAVLRIALGGEMITRVATDRAHGHYLTARLRWLRHQLERAKRKIDCLVAASSDGGVAVGDVGEERACQS